MQKPPPPPPAAKPRKPKINLIKGVKSINQLALSYGKISALCKHPTRSVPGENIRGHGRRRRRRLRSIRFDTHQQRVLQRQPTTTEGNPLQARFIISSHVRTINLPSLPLPVPYRSLDGAKSVQEEIELLKKPASRVCDNKTESRYLTRRNPIAAP